MLSWTAAVANHVATWTSCICVPSGASLPLVQALTPLVESIIQKDMERFKDIAQATVTQKTAA